MEKSSKSSSLKHSSHASKTDKHSEKSLNIHNIPAYFLMGCLLYALYLLLRLMGPFATVIVFAAVLVTAFYPVYRRINLLVKSRSFASLLACLIVTLLIVIPFIVLLFMLASEGANAYGSLQHELSSGYLSMFLKWRPGGGLYDLYQRFLPDLHITSVDISGQISALAKAASSFLLSQAQALVGGIASFLLSFIIMLITMFYFFRDGEKIVAKIMSLSPLSDTYEQKLSNHLKTMMNATLYGTFLTAITQGLLGGIGFAIAGVGQPVLWGATMAFFALFPYIGTAFVWVPASVILFLTHHTGSGIFLLIWGLALVSTIDNFLGPYLIGRSAKTYPLLTFLCVLGGMILWGFPGIVFGPLILTVAVALSEIYQHEYRPILKELNHDGV